mmetsp:Transcript_18548/g.22790  ORF Transcript_18548/g.22790 Transcript_18548/m.22790 type:complete len:166 (-) Transcript_18548:396-893(-)
MSAELQRTKKRSFKELSSNVPRDRATLENATKLRLRKWCEAKNCPKSGNREALINRLMHPEENQKFASRREKDLEIKQMLLGAMLFGDLGMNIPRVPKKRATAPRGIHPFGAEDGDVSCNGNKNKPTKTTTTKWRVALDPKTRRTYYWHRETRKTQWEKPDDFSS